MPMRTRKRRKGLTISERGFFGHGPQDLINKLHHDFNRMKRQRRDWRPVYDFFTTAVQIRGWWDGYCRGHDGKIDPRAEYEEPSDPKTKMILNVCDEIGNGAKHFLGAYEVLSWLRANWTTTLRWQGRPANDFKEHS
jgi:hypothetical protein